jgi:hypothetical protein
MHTVLFWLLYGIIKAFYDLCTHNKLGEYSMDNTWKNKYKTNKDNQLTEYKGMAWYYLGLYKPKYQENFPFSTTLLVMFTDLYHALHTAKIITLIAIALSGTSIMLHITGILLYLLTFNLLYHGISNEKI